ncbi:MAG TPA: hypothetical protein VEC99_18860 [Clostridia bacterium]|nr:hypothetical protein [Clostridia bacterium]
MVGIFKVTEFQARKQALIAESEVYRQTLLLEVQNIRLYSADLKRKVNRLRIYKPLILAAPVAVSMLGSMFRRRTQAKRPAGWRRVLAAVLMGWRFYRKFGPVLQTMVAQQFAQRSASAPPSEEQAPSANI